MAAVMRVTIGCIARKLVQFSFNNSSMRDKGICQFHRSAVLGVIGQEVKMPALSPTMSEGTIVKWLKKEGDSIAAGEVICDIQTDKAVVSFEIDDEGILAKILVPENTPDIKVGTLIALVVNEGEDWKSVEMSLSASAPSSDSGSGSGSGSSSGSASDSGKKPEATVIPGATFRTATLMSYGPAVRILLEKYGLKADAIKPTGFRSKLLKDDVLKYIKSHNLTEKPMKAVLLPSKAAAPSKPVPQPTGKQQVKPAANAFIDIEITSMRKTIAKRLTESKITVPHSYTTIVSDISKIQEYRMKLKAEGVKVSVNDFVVKAVACALQAFPEVNAHWIQDKLVPFHNVDISIAVATDKGLITPIVHNVPGKGLIEISSLISDLAKRAKEGKLQPQEFQGGTFTISNLGMYGISEFTAIINLPQCAILAVGAGTPTLTEDMKVITNMYSTLSYNRQAFDEAVAAEFMKSVQAMLQDPSMMLVGGKSESSVKLKAKN